MPRRTATGSEAVTRPRTEPSAPRTPTVATSVVVTVPSMTNTSSSRVSTCDGSVGSPRRPDQATTRSPGYECTATEGREPVSRRVSLRRSPIPANNRTSAAAVLVERGQAVRRRRDAPAERPHLLDQLVLARLQVLEARGDARVAA